MTATTQPTSHDASPTPKRSSPKPSPTQKRSLTSPAASCTGIAGTTTTIQEVTGDRFSPAKVSISRCDSVKAVYADTSGVPHTWTGSRWDSGSMSAGSNSSYTYRFTSTGTFNFVCSYHQAAGMTGTVKVT